MFDVLIGEVAERFGLGDKGRALLASLLGIVFDERNGGIAGLLARFRQQGLGDLFGSWIGNATPKPIEPWQLEKALGADAISTLAGRLGTDREKTLAAAAAMLPSLIGALTPNGQLPTSLPSVASGYLKASGAGGGFAANANASVPDLHTDLTPGLGWVKWVLLLAVVLALGYCMLHRPTEIATPAASGTSAVPAAPPATAPAPSAEAKVSLTNDAGRIDYSGRLDSAAERSRLVDALNATFGAANVGGGATIDANTKPARWLDALLAVLPEFRGAPGARLDLDGDAITLGGSAAAAERQRLADLLRSRFAGFALNGLDAGVLQSASEAFKALQPGKYTAADLVKALNLMTIHFETGSAAISADSLGLLEEAAAALKNAPAGTRVQVGGHTDNTGDAAANLKLSEARANAVRSKLIELGVAADNLRAQGYGDTVPIADNATEEGRAKNRRMEFTVVE